MKRRSYSSLEEWKKDYIKFTENPNDKHLLSYVVKCIENSTNTIKDQIKDYLSSCVLEKNPWLVFDRVSKENPNHKIVVKTKNDPWFNV